MNTTTAAPGAITSTLTSRAPIATGRYELPGWPPTHYCAERICLLIHAVARAGELVVGDSASGNHDEVGDIAERLFEVCQVLSLVGASVAGQLWEAADTPEQRAGAAA